MELKTFNKEKEYRKLQRNNKAKITYITSLFLVCIITIIIAIVLANSFAFKSEESFILTDATVAELFEYQNFTYTGSAQEFTVPMTGYYNIELWGAQGYNTGTTAGVGYGSYTSGLVYLMKDEVIYFYIGGASANRSGSNGSAGGYNGGGKGGNGNYSASWQGGTGGGGATDIRLVGGTWDNSTSLRSRIMVAAGGGGKNDDIITATVGSGGSLYGGNASSHNHAVIIAGGTQNSGYAFGSGGNGRNSTSDMAGGQGNGGGGGGYYGGNAYTVNARYTNAHGAGGSSYISGYAGVNSVEETGGTAIQPLHTNNTNHYSNKYFINGKMEAGINSGNGKATITYVSSSTPQRTNTKLDNVRYIKSCFNGNNINTTNTWIEIQAIKNGVNLAKGILASGTTTQDSSNTYNRITDGNVDTNISAQSSVSGLQCVTIDLGEIHNLDELVLWGYWRDARKHNDNTLSVGATNTTGTTPLSTIIHNYPGTTGYAETSQGRRYSAWD